MSCSSSHFATAGRPRHPRRPRRPRGPRRPVSVAKALLNKATAICDKEKQENSSLHPHVLVPTRKGESPQIRLAQASPTPRVQAERPSLHSIGLLPQPPHSPLIKPITRRSNTGRRITPPVLHPRPPVFIERVQRLARQTKPDRTCLPPSQRGSMDAVGHLLAAL